MGRIYDSTHSEDTQSLEIKDTTRVSRHLFLFMESLTCKLKDKGIILLPEHSLSVLKEVLQVNPTKNLSLKHGFSW